MREFRYLIKDESGIHAKPAGMLVRETSQFVSSITLSKGEKEADAKRVLSVMGLGARAGDEIVLRAEGIDEKEAVDKLSMIITRIL